MNQNASVEEMQTTIVTPGGRRLAVAVCAGGGPRVVFLGGFTSDMTGRKATHLLHWSQQNGAAYTRFDYSGHGQSSGRFVDGTIGQWTEDALAVIDGCAGPVVLTGSSMGGWIMVLAALARPDRVKGLVGVAAAPDFTEDLIWARLDADARAALARSGQLARPSAYGPEPTIYTHCLVEEARRHLVLRGPIDLDVPVRLLHGRQDTDVPWRTSQRLLDQVTGADKRLDMVADGDHRLSRAQDLDRLGALISEVRGAVDCG